MNAYPLHHAVLQSNYEAATLLISQGVDLDELDEQGQSSLHWAVLRGDDEMVKILLKAGADPNVMSGDGFTPKWSAVDFGLKTIEYILTTYGGIVATNEAFDSVSWSVLKGVLGQQIPKIEKKKRWIWW